MKQRCPGISSRTHTRRTRVIAAVLALGASAFVSRAAQLQIAQGDIWRNKAWRQTTATVEVPAVRGTLYDRHGQPLALSRPSYLAFLAPSEVQDRERTIAIIDEVLELSGSDRAKLRNARKGWVAVGRVTARERERLIASVGPGIHFDPQATRLYPEGKLARSVIGSVSPQGVGLSGLELALDSLLRGTPGERVTRVDGRWGEHYPLPSTLASSATPGRDVYLTLDAGLQEIAEEALAGALQETGASGGDVILAEPRTGEILALASRRPATHGAVPAISDPYEPGSTVKPFLLAALLEEGEASLADRVYVEGGRYRTPYRTITDVHPYDTLTVAEVVRFSSNIGAAKLAERLEPGVQYRYLRDFGFGTPTGVGFHGESGGLLRRPHEWSALSQASLAFGYELLVTSLQLVAAYGALANEGLLMRPGLIREVRDSAGRTTWRREMTIIRRVVTPSTAREVTEVLGSVVGDGTGSRASLATLSVAGKTGTARIATGGRYTERRYAASFVGYAPVEDPQLVILVKLEDPRGRYHGGGTAAPVIRGIVQAILASRGTGLITGATQGERRHRLDWHAPQAAAPPFRLAARTIAPRSGGGDGNARSLRVPDVGGLDVRTAAAYLHDLGLLVELAGSGRVRRQTPAPGATVVAGATVLLE